jgi:choline dehydrogenase-like flavoprotein
VLADLRSDQLPDAFEADVCVVGAGPVGITLGLSLARSGRSVILLESGGLMIEPEVQVLNRSHVVGRIHRGVHEGRVRALGGTSKLWGGQILTYDPINFEPRPWVPWSGWPFCLSELNPYYLMALEFEGLGDCLNEDEDVWRKIRLSLPCFSEGIKLHLSRWCPEPDFGNMYGHEIASAKSLRCILHASVTTLSVTNKVIQSVLAKCLSGKQIRIKASYFAFCAGAIETARILLHETEEGHPAPWAGRNSLLGRCFQDHPTFECADVFPRNPVSIHRLMDMIYLDRHKYQPRLYMSHLRQTEYRSLAAGGILLFKTNSKAIHSIRSAARKFFRQPSPRSSLEAGWAATSNLGFFARQSYRYCVRRRAFNPDDGGVRLLAFVEQAPDVRSRVTLSDDLDRLGMKRVRLEWKLGWPELQTLSKFAQSVRQSFEDSGLAHVVVEPAVAAQDTSFLDRGWDNYHHMGTARAAESCDHGVVDGDLKIFQVDNGYICGCAVFPTGGFSNPTHTAIALALRLADHLRTLS